MHSSHLPATMKILIPHIISPKMKILVLVMPHKGYRPFFFWGGGGGGGGIRPSPTWGGGGGVGGFLELKVLFTS